MTSTRYDLITEVSRSLMDDEGAVTATVGGKVRAEIIEHETHVRVDEPTQIVIEVTNLAQIIRSFEIRVLGIDPANVTFDPPLIDLFPWERQLVTATVTIPTDHPAGRQRLGIEVVEPGRESAEPAVAELAIDVEGRPAMSLEVEPATFETGSTGTFLVHVVNSGNTTLDVELVCQDPERLVTTVFDPERPSVPAGERAVIRCTAKGPRPWFGMPAVRVLELEAKAAGVVCNSAIAMLQRPRISRRLISLLGLLLVISLFAYVIALSFGRVAELSKQNQALVQQGLGLDDSLGRTAPGAFGGTVTSSTGSGIGGAVVRLFNDGDTSKPLATTVTEGSGAFAFGAVADGTYLIQTEAAGFGSLWHPNSPGSDGAEPVELADGKPGAEVAFVLTGRPGAISGQVSGADVEGAIVSVRLPAESVVGSDLEPVAAIVATVAVDATGQFTLPNLATPATYELAVSKEGFATELRAVTLKPGEERASVEVLLQPGIGILGGLVVDSQGQPIGGVSIVATDGTTESTTRSLSDDASAGQFTLRNLATPRTYTLRFVAPGYFTESRTIRLEEEQQRADLRVPMTASTGSLHGYVFRMPVDQQAEDAEAAAAAAAKAANARDDDEAEARHASEARRLKYARILGGVNVTITGTEFLQVTQTLTQGQDGCADTFSTLRISLACQGQWSITGLPVPGTYTVAFDAPGFATTATTIELLPGAGAANRLVQDTCRVWEACSDDIVLIRDTASYLGLVVDGDGPLSGVRVTLESSTKQFVTQTSDEPAGQFRFDRVPPGTYTVTFARAGSSSYTLVVDLRQGQDLEQSTIELQEQASVKGSVRRDGRGVGGVGVLVYRERDYPEGLVQQTETGDDGTFLVIGLDAPETYVIDFQVPAGGAVQESRTVFLQPGVEHPVDVDLSGGTG